MVGCNTLVRRERKADRGNLQPTLFSKTQGGYVMRFLLAGLLMVGTLVCLFDGVQAQEKKGDQKEVTLKGKITCGMCELNQDKECATVVVVKVDKKDDVYYFDPVGHKTHHEAICSGGKNGTVTGTVAEKDKRKVITVKSVKFD
jgi:hypothetical protein